MLEKEKELLKKKYEKCFAMVKSAPDFAHYAEEKYVHSFQVYDMGKYLYEREFGGYSQEFKETALKALLLHDIGRFVEIENQYKHGWGARLDHGEVGAEFLKTQGFDDERILLTIKHHGHMVEDFYADSEYENMKDEGLKKETEKVLFLVRDADKLANFKMFLEEKDIEKGYLYFFVMLRERLSSKYARVSEDVLEGFLKGEVVLERLVKSPVDELLKYISWVYDLNFATSLEFFMENDMLNGFVSALKYFKMDEKLVIAIENKIKDYTMKAVNEKKE